MKHKNSVTDEIQRLKRERNAVILAHNYQIGEVQDVADHLGDSLELSQRAAESSAEVIVFCGVKFMAETASILCPEKTVLIPDSAAVCPMANMVTAGSLKTLRAKYPAAPVVCYVNTTAEVKAESDVCCTSANAVKVVESISSRKVIFVPDKYLAHYVSTRSSKHIIPWNGFCPTHVKILSEHVEAKKKMHPEATVIVHPECTPPVVAMADEVLSTSGMCRYAKRSAAETIIVGTEVGLLYRLRKENPSKTFVPATEHAVCPNMKSITLEKVLWALEDMKHRVKVSPDIRSKAKTAVDRMLAIC